MVNASSSLASGSVADNDPTSVPIADSSGVLKHATYPVLPSQSLEDEASSTASVVQLNCTAKRMPVS